MQIVETVSQGLKRAYTVTIPAADITARIDGEVKRMAPQVRMPGFRAGKVPANLVRKMHGPALRQEALNTSIREAMDRLVAERQLRPAMQPQVEIGEGYADGKDVELRVSLEVLPLVAAPALDGLTLDKLVAPVSDADVEAAIANFATQQNRFEPAEEGRAAQAGDQLLVDYLGKVDDVAFDGGTAENQAIELGAGRLIPGFEEQLIGVTAGEDRRIAVEFPADYGAAQLAGKAATFDIKVHEVRAPVTATIDDDFARQWGLESLDQLRTLLRGQLEQQSTGLTRTQMKRALLDQLAAAHDFEVPPSMVEAEFAQIIAQLEQEAGKEADPAAARAEIEAEKEDYRGIAERRVRLGLLLSEIGQRNGVDITAQEMQALIAQASQQYRPEDRDRFAEYIRGDAMAAAQLRAPLYEDKVVDFLIGKAEVTEREVSRDELQAAIEADEPHVHGPECDHGHDHELAGEHDQVVSEDASVDPGAIVEPQAPEVKSRKRPTKKAVAAELGGEAAVPIPDAGADEIVAQQAANMSAARKSAPVSE